MEARETYPHELEALPLDQLPEPLVPGGFSRADDIAVTAQPAEDEEVDYDVLVMSAAIAALTVLLAKIVSVLLISNFEGATIGVRFARGFIPYFAIVADPVAFTTIVTMSTAGMAFAAVVLMVFPAISPNWTRVHIYGIALGLVMTLETFLLEAFRHFMWSEVVRWDLAWITLFQLLIGFGLLVLALKTPRYVADIDTRYVPLAAWEHVLEDKEQ